MNNYFENLNEISKIAKQKIDDYLKFETKKYAYFDFK